ncbi:MAG TPA: class I SAM-dependent methyltransferase [Candidatus Dormibacteraeota bacterium]|nr:class I SAM-dependent methyltransferase [Verrucomicrobiae bacterium]HXJ74065.1 class I SAM-dependent methyltransferase [Candidatus Dormibacteraeota bacterium]
MTIKFTKERSIAVTREEAEQFRDARFAKNASLVRLDQNEKKCVRSLLQLVPAGSLLLDIPCGTGRFHELLRQHGCRILAADISEEMLSLARAAGLAEDYLLGDAENLSLPDKSVDGVFCIRLFHHVGSPQTRLRLFQEFARVTRRWVLVSFYHSHCLKRFKKLVQGKPVSGEHVGFATLRAEAAAAGLQVVRTAAVARYVRPQWFVLFAVHA